jgi:hypothetical protein
MKRWLLMLLLLPGLMAACGESDQEKAQNTVCDARADIEKQVNELSNLTLQTATVDAVRNNLNAIQKDLGKISDAQGDLANERKQQVESANKQFTSQLKSIAGDLGSSLSANDAKAQLQSAFDQLAGAYRQTFAKVDCS